MEYYGGVHFRRADRGPGKARLVLGGVSDEKTIKTAALALMLAFLMPWLAACQPNREIPSAGPAATDSA